MSQTESPTRLSPRRRGARVAWDVSWAAQRPPAKQRPRRPPLPAATALKRPRADRTGIWPQAERTKTR